MLSEHSSLPQDERIAVDVLLGFKDTEPSRKKIRLESDHDNFLSLPSSSPSQRWLDIVMNPTDVEPRQASTWHYRQQQQQQQQQKQRQYLDKFFDHTLSIPVQTPYNNGTTNLYNDNHQLYKEPNFDISLSTQQAPWSDPLLTENQVREVVQHLNTFWQETKRNIWDILLQWDDSHPTLNTTPMLSEINHSLHKTFALYPDLELPNFIKVTGAQWPQIAALADLRTLVFCSSTSQFTELVRQVIDFYCLMTAFTTTCQIFFDRVVRDLLGLHAIPETFMSIFHEDDNFLASNINIVMSTSRTEDHRTNGMDAFTWHYHWITLGLQSYPNTTTLHRRLDSLLDTSISSFFSIDSIEIIFSSFYTQHFLRLVAPQHQKDHGQFYTPRPVIKFMWDRIALTNEDLLEKSIARSDSGSGDNVVVPRVFDPCMGIGGFLCEFIDRVILSTKLHHPKIWNDPIGICTLLSSLCESVWGIEIDGFAFHLGKMNIMIHLLPIYKHFIDLCLKLGYSSLLKLPRLHLFCNDTLQLRLPHSTSPSSDWERAQLRLLRDCTSLNFRYIVTNPPYMIRKTGYVSVPDPQLYDERVLGGRGAQAYLYFIWICLQRLEPEHGVCCLITPSQWLGLEFAESLRGWVWSHCRLEELYQFEPFKIWRRVQTDSLIFKIRRRTSPSGQQDHPILFLRYMDRKASLIETLKAYSSFRATTTKMTMATAHMHMRLTPAGSFNTCPTTFTLLAPTSNIADTLTQLTSHLPGICDASGRGSAWSRASPLIWHRGPNTNPVYALVVRTRWAREIWGHKVCDRWLRPVFYWNGKYRGEDGEALENKEAMFWRERDELRLIRKENSPAEAFVRLREGEVLGEDSGGYSMIMVDKEGAEKLKLEEERGGLWEYLKEARCRLQAGMMEKEVAWCGFGKCGMDVPVKIIHPINYGYFSKNQPRQRFFLDKQSICVTNQCIYFTVKPGPPRSRPSYEYFLGFLNSSTCKFFLGLHCRYDQQGRMRLFRENMARIPYAAPSSPDDVSVMVRLVESMMKFRTWILRLASVEGVEGIVEKMRRGEWRVVGEASERLNEFWMARVHASSKSLNLNQILQSEEDNSNTSLYQSQIISLLSGLLYASALLQYAIDQFVYRLYRIPPQLQIDLESELRLDVPDEISEDLPREEQALLGQGSCSPKWIEKVYSRVDEITAKAELTFKNIL